MFKDKIDIAGMMKAMFLDGKTDDEVTAAIISSESVKAAGISAKEVAEALLDVKALQDVKSHLESARKASEDLEVKKASDAEFERRLDEKIADKLKTIEINPKGNVYGSKITKEWDHAKKDFVSVDDSRFSESHKVMNDLLLANFSRDFASAQKISSEIDSDNTRFGVKAAVRSDSNSVGGYSIPTEVEGRIQQLTYASSVILPKVYTDTIIVEGKVYPTIGAVSMADIADQDSEITETNPTFYNPTIEMKRVGAFTRVSNTILRQKGADLTSAFNTAYASSRARYIDTRLSIGNVTGAGNSQDGLVWLGIQESSPVAIGSVTLETLIAMTENVNQELDWSRVAWMMNQKMYNVIGQLGNPAGQYVFPEYFTGGNFKPLGYDIIRNVRMTNELQVGEDNSAGGTDTAIVFADFSKVIVGLEGGLRIRSTMDERPLKDQTTFIGTERMGWDLLFDNSSAPGGICRVQEITGA